MGRLLALHSAMRSPHRCTIMTFTWGTSDAVCKHPGSSCAFLGNYAATNWRRYLQAPWQQLRLSRKLDRTEHLENVSVRTHSLSHCISTWSASCSACKWKGM